MCRCVSRVDLLYWISAMGKLIAVAIAPIQANAAHTIDERLRGIDNATQLNSIKLNLCWLDDIFEHLCRSLDLICFLAAFVSAFWHMISLIASNGKFHSDPKIKTSICWCYSHEFVFPANIAFKALEIFDSKTCLSNSQSDRFTNTLDFNMHFY